MPLPPIDDVIAHRGDMLLLDHLCAVDGESCSAEYTPRWNAWYADAAGNMPAWIGIELMAQTIAAYVGMSKRNADLPPKQGVLLGTRSYKPLQASFAAGCCLRIEARMLFRDVSGLGAFECSIAAADEPQMLLASATLKVYEPEDFDAFMKERQA